MSRTEVTYPDLEVELLGGDGNAFALIGTTRRAIARHAGEEAAAAFVDEATACGSYDELLGFIMRTVEVA